MVFLFKSIKSDFKTQFWTEKILPCPWNSRNIVHATSLLALNRYKSRLLPPSSKEVKVHLGRITFVTPIILKYILTNKDTLLTLSASPLKSAKMTPICRKPKGNAFLILSSLQHSLYQQYHPLLASSNCSHETPPSKTQLSEGSRNDKASSHCRHQIKALQTHPRIHLNHAARGLLGPTPSAAGSHLRIPCFHLIRSSIWHGEKPGFKNPPPISTSVHADNVSLRKNARRLQLITIS